MSAQGEQVVVWGLVFVYCAAMVWVGLRVNRWIRSGSDFLVAGRDVSWVLQGLGLSSIVVAGTTLATQGAIGYLSGMSAHWWVTGWCIAVTIGALAFAGFYRRTGAYTLSEWLGAYYGERVRLAASFALAIGCFFSPLANILGGGVVLSGLTGMPTDWSVILIGGIVATYLFCSGLWGALVTDLVQWILCVVAFLIIIPAYALLGSHPGMWQQLPPSFWDLGSAPALPWFQWTLPSVLGMFWLMFSIGTGGFYWPRACSSRTVNETRKAWLLAVVISLPFGFVGGLAGMYLRAAGVELAVPDQAIGVFLQQIPVLARAIAVVGILAATMSTVEAGVHAGSMVLVRDLGRHFGGGVAKQISAARWITLVYTLAATAGAMGFNHLIPVLGSAMAVALLAGFLTSLIPPLLGTMMWRGSSKEGAFLGVIIATATTFHSMFLSDIWRRYHPVFTGFIVSAVVFVLVSLLVRVTGPWWRERRQVAL